LTSNATTVDEYLAGLPEDRRAAISAVRQVILDHLPEGFEEGMQYGMIGYYVPHRIFPAGYHCDPRQPLPYAALGSQKNHMAVYLMCVYGDPATEQWFREAYAATGKKLDMGKSCIPFKKLGDLPLDVIGQAIARISASNYVGRYEQMLGAMKSRQKK
jgi:hypothetical protein